MFNLSSRLYLVSLCGNGINLFCPPRAATLSRLKFSPPELVCTSPLCDTLDPYKCLHLFSAFSCCPASPAPSLKSSSHTFTSVALGFVMVPYQKVLTASMLLFSTQLTSELCQKKFFKFSWGCVRLSSSLRKLTAFSEFFNY